MNFNLIFNNNNSTNYADTLRFAAEEFASHISRLTVPCSFLYNDGSSAAASSLPITFEVCGDLTEFGLGLPANPLLDDQYHISIGRTGGCIKGSNARSVLLGVYAYLRNIGFRFLAPGQTFLPSIASDEALFTQFSSSASLRHRGVCIEGANSLENALDFIDWLPKLGFNSFFTQFKYPYIFFQRWYAHTNNPLLTPESFGAAELAFCCEALNEALRQRSLLHHAVGHGWTCEAIGLPSIGWVKGTEDFDEKLRPYLAELEGKRDFHGNTPLNTNLCYSNKDVTDTLCQCILRYAREHREVSYLHIWLADEANNICECSECRKTTLSDQYVHILNRVDELLTEEGLTTKLVFLLYQELLYAPLHEKLKNKERFTLMFAPISRTFEKSYPTKPVYTELPAYVRNRVTLPVTIEENITYLMKWQERFTGDSFVYDYPLGRAHYGDFGYVSIARVLSEDIKALPLLHLNGYISCQELRAASPNALPNYIMGYTLFNSSLSFDELAEEYFSAAYGRDYSLAAAYLDKLSSLASCDYFNGKGERINPEYEKSCALMLDTLRAFQPVIDKNKKNSANISSFFWNLLDYHNAYCILLVTGLSHISGGRMDETAAAYDLFCDYIRKNELSYQSSLDVYRIIEVSCRYTGFEQKNRQEYLSYV